MKIITISRQFGSGGRELGKRLADILGWDYYDKEIIEALSENQGMSQEQVSTPHRSRTSVAPHPTPSLSPTTWSSS
ncbi:MAG: cytidylate kinase family protein, partial [Oscillospiraceae bacterium]|nr:cytidylate kinase family protein [Oscillospiraceae bacterium]